MLRELHERGSRARLLCAALMPRHHVAYFASARVRSAPRTLALCAAARGVYTIRLMLCRVYAAPAAALMLPLHDAATPVPRDSATLTLRHATRVLLRELLFMPPDADERAARHAPCLSVVAFSFAAAFMLSSPIAAAALRCRYDVFSLPPP